MTRTARLVSTIGLGLAVALLWPTTGWTSGGTVAPPSARPYGYSLEQMAEVTAPFTRSGNDPASYPDTPFQILYVTDVDYALDGSGVVGTGSNQFSVAAGTTFYVPLLSVNDLPPVLGQFPISPAEASAYLFAPSQYGGRDFEVVIDGEYTLVGPEYLVGPITVDGSDGVRMVTLAAFVGPLRPGTHTVQVRGGVYGDLVDDTYGVSFIREDLTYTVEVR